MIVYSSKTWKIAEEHIIKDNLVSTKSLYTCFISKKPSMSCYKVRKINSYSIQEYFSDSLSIRYEVIECRVVNSH